jgi:MFS family permease
VRFRDQLRTFPPAAWILFGGVFVNRFGTFVVPFLVLYLTRLGYSTAQAGVALGAYGAGHIIASSLGGHLADRIGRRNTIVLSMFGSAAAMLALSQAHSYGSIIVVTFIAAATGELYRPASHALIGDLIGAEHRVGAFGIYRFAVNLGFAAGPAMAGFLAEHSFFYLFIGDALTSAIYGAIALFALPQGLRTYSKDERIGEALRIAGRDLPFLVFLAATLCYGLVEMQTLSTFALYVTSVVHSTRIYGLLLSLNGVLIILFELGITNLTQRMPARPVIAVGYFLGGFGYALTGLARSVPALAVTVVIWTLGEMVSSPMAGAYVSRIAPENVRGRYMGMMVTMWSIAMLIGPMAGTLIFQRDPTVLWVGCGMLGVTSAALLLYTPPRPET